MATGFLDDPVSYIFGANTGMSYEQLKQRRAIAAALASRQHNKFPSNVGEGLTYLGEALGKRFADMRTDRAEREYNERQRSILGALSPEGPAAPPPAGTVPPGRRVEASPPDVRDQAEYNAIDATALPAGWETAIERQPEQLRDYLRTTASRETDRGRDLVSPTGAAGPLQFTSKTGGEYGLVGPGFDRRQDPNAAFDAGTRLTMANAGQLTQALGRQPTFQELAMAHQQGAAGATALLQGRLPPAGNRAVNRLDASPTADPAALTAQINRFYGFPPGAGPGSVPGAPAAAAGAPVDPRDAATAALMQQPQATGMGAMGPALASAGSATGTASDAPPIGAPPAPPMGPGTRDSIAAIMTPPPPTPAAPAQFAQAPGAPGFMSAAPLGGPPQGFQPGPAAGPLPPAAMAQAGPPATVLPMPAPRAAPPPAPTMPAGIPGPLTPPSPVPATPSVGRPPSQPLPPGFTQQLVRPTPPQYPPISTDEMRASAAMREFPGDPAIKAQAEWLAARGKERRDAQYLREVEEYKSKENLVNQQIIAREQAERDRPKIEAETRRIEQEIAAKQREEERARRMGGLRPEFVEKTIEESSKGVKEIPSSVAGIANAKNALLGDAKMFTGSDAEIQLSMAKLKAAAGMPSDPRIASTEQFKSFMAPVVAQMRQALVGGANISNEDIKRAEAAAAGDIKLSRESIQGVLESIERINLATAVNHQRKLLTATGADPDAQRNIFGLFGVPTETMVRIVPDGAVKRLREHADNPAAHRDFDEAFHTPGLSQHVLRFQEIAMGMFDEFVSGAPPAEEKPQSTPAPAPAAPYSPGMFRDYAAGAPSVPTPPTPVQQFNKPFGEIKADDPSPSERVYRAGQDILMGAGAQPYVARRLSEGLVNTASLLPMMGGVLSAADAGFNITRGNFGHAALDAVGAYPAVRAAKRYFQGAPRLAPDIPTSDELGGTIKSGYRRIEQSPVELDPRVLTDITNTGRIVSTRTGKNPINAPNTYATYDLADAAARRAQQQTATPGNRPFVTPADLDTFRQQFRNPVPFTKDSVAGRDAISVVDAYLAAPPPGRIVAGSAADVAALRRDLTQARGDYNIKRLSDAVTGRLEDAELRAAAANSGRNFDNTIRSKLAALRTTKAGRREFGSATPAEEAAVDEVIRGDVRTNIARYLSNVLGGGGGIAQGVVGGAGYAAGHGIANKMGLDPITSAGAGVAGGGILAGVGSALRSYSNARTQRAAEKAAELIRSRSPEYQRRLAEDRAQGGPFIDPVARRRDLMTYLLIPQLRAQGQEALDSAYVPYENR